MHIFAAALGLSALLATSATAFAVVKYAGAFYLLYIGISQLCNRGKSRPEDQHVKSAILSFRKTFLQGFLTNALNPKVAIFFLAFVPQFIASTSPNKAFSFIVLGCIFNLSSMLWCNFLAVSSAYASTRIKTNKTVAHWINRAVGALFVSFALKLALSDRTG